MEVVKKLYLQIYFFVMALYVFFNKGIAYSFLAEALWAGGFIVLFNAQGLCVWLGSADKDIGLFSFDHSGIYRLGNAHL
jgi:lipoprotein signal peptidase